MEARALEPRLAQSALWNWLVIFNVFRLKFWLGRLFIALWPFACILKVHWLIVPDCYNVLTVTCGISLENTFLFIAIPAASFNSLPNDEILVGTELKAFADNKLNVSKIPFSVFNRVENNVGNGENAGYQHFVFSHSVFQSHLYRVVKSRGFVVKG